MSQTALLPTDELKQKAKSIQLLLLDVDGILSDGKLYYTAAGDEIKTFHTQDGHGIKMLQRSGVAVGIITGRTSPIVQRRVKELGITLLLEGREDKFTALNELLESHPCQLENIAFMGDDWPREACDLIMKAQNTFADALALYTPSKP